MGGLTADPGFLREAGNFICVRLNTKECGADLVRQLGVQRGSVFLVFQASDGRVLDRLNLTRSGSEKPKAGPTAARMREVAEASLADQTDFLLHFLDEADPPDGRRRELEADLQRLGDDDLRVRELATIAFLRAGRSACGFLRRTTSADPEIRARVADILLKICPGHDSWAARGLDHDVDRLLQLGEQAKDDRVRGRALARLRAILPSEARLAPDWWLENRGGLFWDSAKGKYLPANRRP